MANDYLDRSYWNALIKMSLSRLFILKILCKESLHGYEITKRISELTKGCCAPTEGALYPVLKEFEAGGYLECRSEVVSGRTRKIYKITDKGVRAFHVGLEAWYDTAKALVDEKEKLES